MLMGHHRQLCPLRPRASAVLPIELGRMEHIMDEKTSSAPMQEDPQKGEELSFTITGEDAEAQDALNAEKPEPQQKKKSRHFFRFSSGGRSARRSRAARC